MYLDNLKHFQFYIDNGISVQPGEARNKMVLAKAQSSQSQYLLCGLGAFARNSF